MEFLHASALTYIWLALLPAAVYFFFAAKPAKVKVGSLFLIKRAYEKTKKTTTAKTAAALILRTLAVACAVIALAKPAANIANGFLASYGRSSSADIVILADTSMSMRAMDSGAQIFESARGEILSLVSQLKAGDRVALAGFSDTVSHLVFTDDMSALRREVSALRPTYGGTNYANALNAAASALSKSKAKRKAVFIFTDGARHGFGAPVTLPSDTLIAGTIIEGNRANGAVTAVNIEQNGWKVPPAIVAEATGATALRVVTAAGTRTLRIDAHDGKAVMAASANTPIYGRAAKQPDALAADDVRYFSFEPARAPKLLCLYANPDFQRAGRPGSFIAEALGHGRGAAPSCDFADIAASAAGKLSGYDGVLLYSPSGVPETLARALRQFAAEGGGLFILVPPASPVAYANLSGLLPANNFSRVEAEAGLAFRDTRYGEDFDTAKIRFHSFYSAETVTGAEVSARFASGGRQYPAMTEKRYGKGKVFLWLAGLEAENGNFPLKPLFPVWLADKTAELTGNKNAPESFETTVGEPFAVKAQNASGATVSGPDTPPYKAAAKNGEITFSAAVPGLYELRLIPSGKTVRVAVNPELRGGENELLAGKATWKSLPLYGAGKAFARLLGLADLSPLFWFAAMVFLLCEMLALKFF